LFAALDIATEAGDGNMVSRLAGAIHKNLQLVGNFLGQIGGHSTTSITNVVVLPEYCQLRIDLVRALQPWPEARQAVAAVLHAVEEKAAKQIEDKGQRRELIEMAEEVAA
jgi:hypothetical protein